MDFRPFYVVERTKKGTRSCEVCDAGIVQGGEDSIREEIHTTKTSLAKSADGSGGTKRKGLESGGSAA